jgi:hypothetical protein
MQADPEARQPSRHRRRLDSRGRRDHQAGRA